MLWREVARVTKIPDLQPSWSRTDAKYTLINTSKTLSHAAARTSVGSGFLAVAGAMTFVSVGMNRWCANCRAAQRMSPTQRRTGAWRRVDGVLPHKAAAPQVITPACNLARQGRRILDGEITC